MDLSNLILVFAEVNVGSLAIFYTAHTATAYILKRYLERCRGTAFFQNRGIEHNNEG